ncbi:hypothetical protein SAMN05421823_112195 [Catalinimonas alkaloidigena]|uniref:Uncharacterized protein n=1 Tax=Catalinimonas alkaloidigena TaxID=1075417 RepID=A0A1G9SKH8_9BACT|nr:hypothetical protein [Catalinimonas alkaloidigena]SDM35921.1 hypothetical protein SAMN05421823_112195 [Catalinimonas alkaloidigena]
MNKLCILTLCVLMIPSGLFAQDSEKDVEQIRAWYKEVNAGMRHYKKVAYPDVQINRDQSPAHFSKEGAQLYRLASVTMTKYFKGEQLVKMIVEFEGDREDLTSAYYFRNDSLFFVEKDKTVYHRPKWDDNFQETEKSVARNHFYIRNNHLLVWVNPEVKQVGTTDPSFHQQEAMILNDYPLYVSTE